ncbi:1,4-alpha-glucan branching protein GlgB [Yinghuangia sp. ASG 101]|uniref:1,4-alpha-glucan branching protein GlgB n=1 Tax=Yinghuangia sp. ASG 101 TaxID=2896848 RepID=UPI001E42C577|nr:1,4-alpha-glucan branching protein GlgB [Yinghuangia sp. ASG 101]UGQ14216.1 1,4-alpha-glucan branching protein GlgB [Yinghuangia sp. ASG 101]
MTPTHQVDSAQSRPPAESPNASPNASVVESPARTPDESPTTSPAESPARPSVDSPGTGPVVPSAATPPVDPGELRRLLDGRHHDPHGILGPHPTANGAGVVVRVLRPWAERVVVTAEGRRYELSHEAEGLFSGELPLGKVPDYRLDVTYEGSVVTSDDPYRFLPTVGEFDLHLISEGRHEQLWTVLGAHVRTRDTPGEPVGGTAFAVWAPNAQGVRLVGDFNYWDGTAHPMRSLGSSGVWELFVPEVGDGTRYKYEITGRDGHLRQKADPLAFATETPPQTASVVSTSWYEWGDDAWMTARTGQAHHARPMSVYEVHLGSWRPGLSYREIAEQLPAYAKDMGFTHVELLPVAEHPFGGSWGYQVTSYYAPTSRFGSPDDFRRLVDALHQAGIGVIVDWVPAHFPRDDWALARFDGTPLYEHPDPRRGEHPDWGTLVFDYGRHEVRNFLVANAVYWCEEFHIDGLRVDAVASMLYLDYSREGGDWAPNSEGGRENWDAVRFLQEMNATVYRRVPGIMTIAEESTAWDGVTRPTSHGGLGFGMKWNMGWMHDSLVYIQKEPIHRQFHHNEITFSLMYAWSENYVLPISHDEVVHGKRSLLHKMPGDRWQQMANVRAYLGFMWSHPGKQLVYMGTEFAQDAEWSEAHGLDWWLLDHAEHQGVQRLVRDLNAVYRDTAALWSRDTTPDGFTWIDGGNATDNVLSFIRHGASGELLVAVCNFSPVVRTGTGLRLPAPGAWREVLNTDAGVYGGSGVGNPEAIHTDASGHATVTLPPLATIWLKPADATA